ncbi:MAG TPA: ParA family protein [Desulfomonilaceae bacterium]|nr:ParA family protein [Desulfomonilaceae bacterium]
MGQIISFVNLKGGVGKTALAVNVGVSLAAQLGQRVLIIDLDPQGNASLWLQGQKEWVDTVNNRRTKTVYGLLSHNTPVGQCIVRSPVIDEAGHVAVEKLDLIPATIHLMFFEEDHHSKDGQLSYYVRFYQEIEILRSQYEFIFLDCPPNIYKTTKCALFAADQIVVPCNPDALSWMGLQLLAQRIKIFANQTMGELESCRPGAKLPLISGLVLNNIQTSATVVLKKAEERLETRLAKLKTNGLVRDDAEIFPVKIRHAAAFHKGSFEFRPLLFSESPNWALLEDYQKLATIFLNRFGGGHGYSS